MAEILKVTSPINVKDRVSNLPKQMPDSIFDMGGTEDAVKPVQKQVTDQSGNASQEQNILNLTKEILKPLNELTSVQSDNMKELMSILKIMTKSEATATSKITSQFLEEIFINPKELQAALVARDKGETPFKGEAFDILRMLSDAFGGSKGKHDLGRTIASQAVMDMTNATSGNPKTGQIGTSPNTLQASPTRAQDAIAAILRHFDGIVNQDNSLKAIVQQSKNMIENMYTADKQIVADHISKLEALMNQTGQTDKSVSPVNIEPGKLSNPIEADKASVQIEKELVDIKRSAGEGIAELNSRDNKEVRQFLKNEYIPMLSSMVTKYQQNDNIRNPVMSIIHYIVRFDKGEPKLLNQAIEQLSEELKPLTGLSNDDLSDMKKLIIDAAKDFRAEDMQQDAEKKFMSKFGLSPEEGDIATLLSKSLNDAAPQKTQSLAMNMLHSLISSESPVMPLMHFMLPVKYGDENTFVEFFIDKKADERKGEAQEAKTIFFTIQSEKFGTFEVDLLEKDMMIDLDIKCPAPLVEGIREVKNELRDDISEQGYRLAGYQVSDFVEQKPVMRRFPKLAQRKVGMDVKI